MNYEYDEISFLTKKRHLLFSSLKARRFIREQVEAAAASRSNESSERGGNCIKGAKRFHFGNSRVRKERSP